MNLQIVRNGNTWTAMLSNCGPVKFPVIGIGRSRREAISNWKRQIQRLQRS